MSKTSLLHRNIATWPALTAIGMALVACSSDVTEEHSGLHAIRLTHEITVNVDVTRYSDPVTNATQSTSIYPGQKLFAWGNFTDNGAMHFTAWELMAGSSGGLLTGSLQYYDADNQPIDIISVQGNFSEPVSEASKTAYPTTLTHSVKDDQTAKTDYASSDLLWARVNNQTYSEGSTEAIRLEFAHLLSKVEVTLVKAEDETYYTTDDLAYARVELMNVCRTVTLTMADGSISAATSSGTVVAKAANSTVGYNGDWLETVLPPQTLQKDKTFICVTMTNHNNRQLFYQLPAALTLEANKRYRFRFAISSQSLTLAGVTYQDTFDGQAISPVPEP